MATQQAVGVCRFGEAEEPVTYSLTVLYLAVSALSIIIYSSRTARSAYTMS